MIIGIIGWVIIGLVVGYLVSKGLDLHGDDPRVGIAVAAGGAIISAMLYTIISGAGVSAFNFLSLLFAAGGAAVVVTGWHMIRSKSVSRAPYTRRRSY